MPRWFEQYRQDWIAEMLDVYGFINRDHLQRKFGISQPQASKDLQAFLKAHPSRMTYDLSQKCYVAVQGESLRGGTAFAGPRGSKVVPHKAKH